MSYCINGDGNPVENRTLWMDEAKKVQYLKDQLQELEDTLGLRNRSNSDLTIEDEQPKSIFDKWKECKD